MCGFILFLFFLRTYFNATIMYYRSLFVPYFKYLVKGCVQLLTDTGDVRTLNLSRKKKKAKIQETGNVGNNVLSLKSWHLRALILSSLHRCFLYDTGSLKFLDSSNFEASHSLPL